MSVIHNVNIHGCLIDTMKKQTDIESLKCQIEYMREMGCNKLADLLEEDLAQVMANLSGGQ